VASQIISTLRLTDPELDTSVGTTTRKIIDAVSESVAEAYIDSYLLSYQYDIDSKIEADLDDFVQLFGLARLAGKRASGTVVFTRAASSSLTSTVFIPVNTEITSTTTPPVVVQTVSGAYIEPGAMSVTVAVQAVESGPSGNLAANALTAISTPIAGVGSVANVSPLTGGTSQETDEELRTRWKKTVFRNLAGTEQMYLGVALDDPNCYAANVIGASKKRREQVQIVAGVGQTTVDDAFYIYSEPVFVGENIDAGDIALKGRDYSWDTTVNPPKVNVLDATKIPDETMIEVDFEYQPLASRNRPESGITNRVDLWVGGRRAQSAVQTVVFNSTNVFNDIALPTVDPLSRHKFRRFDETPPAIGNVFVPLAFGPIMAVPSTLSVSGQVFGLATAANPMGTEATIGGETVRYAYRVVHQDDAFGYTPTSAFGLEWHNAVGYLPPDGAVFTVGGQSTAPYLYNAMVASIQTAVERWRLLGVDARTHQAKLVELRLSLAIMYEPRANQPVVNSEIDRALGEHFVRAGFQGRVQISDLLQIVHNVPGVDNVRFLHGGDHAGYNSAAPNGYTVGVQRMVEGVVTQSFVDATGRPSDLRFGDGELPVFHSAVKVLRAENSFGGL
jgi:uncharacterized phage protein gp47/JayE